MNKPLANMPNGECFRLIACEKGSRSGDPFQVMPVRKWAPWQTLAFLVVTSGGFWLGVVGAWIEVSR